MAPRTTVIHNEMQLVVLMRHLLSDLGIPYGAAVCKSSRLQDVPFVRQWNVIAMGHEHHISMKSDYVCWCTLRARIAHLSKYCESAWLMKNANLIADYWRLGQRAMKSYWVSTALRGEYPI